MLKWAKYLCLLGLLAFLGARGDVRGCHCDTSNPAEMAQKACDLCVLAEQQPAYVTVFFIKDANPTKPDRLLALPRAHGADAHLLSSLPPDVRLELWSAAIARARELWGDEWGIAGNGVERRSQCHTHLHIGKLLPNSEADRFLVVDGPAYIPVPADGGGILVHPVGAKLHVHLGDQAPELRLMR